MTDNVLAVPEPRSGCAKGECPKPGTDVLYVVPAIAQNQQLSFSRCKW